MQQKDWGFMKIEVPSCILHRCIFQQASRCSLPVHAGLICIPKACISRHPVFSSTLLLLDRQHDLSITSLSQQQGSICPNIAVVIIWHTLMQWISGHDSQHEQSGESQAMSLWRLCTPRASRAGNHLHCIRICKPSRQCM